jgi:hypothetical protein
MRAGGTEERLVRVWMAENQLVKEGESENRRKYGSLYRV